MKRATPAAENVSPSSSHAESPALQQSEKADRAGSSGAESMGDGNSSPVRERRAPALISGNEALALAARDAGIALGTGYPGTPSTEILEELDRQGGRAQWAPNEKVALEVALGAAYCGARALVTMKHVGLNVAADPLFTAAYTGVAGALVVVTADDPGMASSQNEQDNRHYAAAARLPMLEPADSQQAYEFLLTAVWISERWGIPVLLRPTTRVCHGKSIVRFERGAPAAPAARYEKDVRSRVMIPAHAGPAHRALEAKLKAIAAWNDERGPNQAVSRGVSGAPAIIASGIAAMHALEAAPQADVLMLGMTYPPPLGLIRRFAAAAAAEGHPLHVIEEGDPVLAERLRAAGLNVQSAPEDYRFGELNVNRVRAILSGETAPTAATPAGQPPRLCTACPHRSVFSVLRDLNCIVAGDIGCYTLGVLPPYEALDTCVCMGASIGVGLGMRHVLPREEAKRVVSVIGDSTFIHSGLTGLVEMVYNPPPTGHVVLILDNGTTAMTGLQEHPGTGRRLGHEPTARVDFEEVIRAIGIREVHVIDATEDVQAFETLLRVCLDGEQPAVIIARRPCMLAAGRIRRYEKAAAETAAGACGCAEGEER